MKITELASDYAEQNTLTLISDAIKKAFEDGYKVGYVDGKNEVEIDDEDRFVDLGLPSGTLWAKNYVLDQDGKCRHFEYSEASNYSLPTKDQIEELVQECEVSLSPLSQLSTLCKTSAEYHSVTFTGKNGNKLSIMAQGHRELRKSETFGFGTIYFWMNSYGSSRGYAARFSQNKFGIISASNSLFCVLEVK